MRHRLPAFFPALVVLLTPTLPAQFTVRHAGAPLPPRAGHYAFFDDARGRVTVLAGQTSATAFADDCWQLDDGPWAQVPIPAGNARAFGGCCEDPAGFGAGLVFGGNTANGTLLASTLRWNRGTLRFDTLTPAASPPARWNTAMALDTARGRVVLFGGGFGGGRYGDTWEWDGSNWQQRFPVQSPSPRANHAMAYDAARGRVVLYGGHNGASLAETWLYDGTTWTNVTTAGPGAVHNLMLAYDQSRARVVQFGGKNDFGTLNDALWEWDGSAWSGPLQPTARPAARELASLTYDKQRHCVTLVGGQDQSHAFLGDAWQWNGTIWTRLLPNNRGTLVQPSARSAPIMGYSEARDAITLFGGSRHQGFQTVPINDTWESAGDVWQQRAPTTSPPTSYAAAGAMLRGTGSLCLVPGKDILGNPYNEQWVYGSNGLWTSVPLGAAPIAPAHQVLGSLQSSQFGWVLMRLVTTGSGLAMNSTLQLIVPNTGVVQPMFPAGGPPPLLGSTMAQSHSPAVQANKVWLFGGMSTSLAGTTYSSDIWELADTGTGGNLAWTLVTPASGSPVPPPRRDAAAGYLDANGTIVIMGGSNAISAVLGDSWQFDLGSRQWTQLAGPLPSARRGAVITPAVRTNNFTYLMLTGGTDGSTELDDTWWMGSSYWIHRDPLPVPPARVRHTMVYDRSNHSGVLFGGGLSFFSGAGYYFNDTWRYDGIAWHPIVSLGTTPLTRADAAACYDEAHARMVMFGGLTTFGGLADTWLLSSSDNWSRGASGPPPTGTGAMVYVASQQRSLLYGGNGETWTYDAGTDQWQQGPNGPTRFRHAMAYDRLRDRVVLFGGAPNGGGGPFGPPVVPDAGTWEYQAATGWQQRSPAHQPPARLWHTMAFDESRARTVMCGGVPDLASANTATFADLWEWDGNDWTERVPDTIHVGLIGMAMVYDPDRARLVYYGGGTLAYYIPYSDHLTEIDARIDTAGAGNAAHPEALRFFSQPVLGQPLNLGFANPLNLGLYTIGWGPLQQPLAALPVPPMCEPSSIWGATISQVVLGNSEPQINWTVPNTPLILGVTLVFQAFSLQAANCWRATDALHVHF